MEYIFENNSSQLPNGKVINRPDVVITDADKYGQYFNTEISCIVSLDYLNDIVMNLEDLIDGTIEKSYQFGYEIYFIICDAQFCRCHNAFDSTAEYLAEPDSAIPTKEVLQLMTDWRDYIIQWEAEYLDNDDKS